MEKYKVTMVVVTPNDWSTDSVIKGVIKTMEKTIYNFGVFNITAKTIRKTR